ncbi:hypothetical protein BSNK01_05420 [Bacillaceae bacterium]
MALTLDIVGEPPKVTLKIKGILDYSTIETFHQRLQALENCTELVVDFSEMGFIDSTGIGGIMELIYLSREKGFSLTFHGLDAETREIFATVGIFQILEALQKERPA